MERHSRIKKALLKALLIIWGQKATHKKAYLNDN